MPTTGTLFFGNVRLGNPDSQWDVLTATEASQTVGLSWPSAGGSPTSYEVSVDGSVTNVGNVTSYTASGLTVGSTYEFKVRPVYSDGSTGGWSYFKNRGPNGFNEASGGTVTDVADYNGSGETWRVHTFTSNDTLTVTSSPGLYPFRVLLVGGGRGGGSTQGPGAPIENRRGGNGGSGGKVYSNDSQSFSAGSLAVTVGSGGSPAARTGNLGGASTIDTVTSESGSAVGGGGQTYGAGNAGAAGPENNITGTTTRYGGGGGSGGNPQLQGGGAGGAGGGGGGGRGAYFDGDGAGNGGSAGANTGGGGGGAGGTGDRNVHNQPRTGGYGGSGIVIVAYRIA